MAINILKKIIAALRSKTQRTLATYQDQHPADTHSNTVLTPIKEVTDEELEADIPPLTAVQTGSIPAPTATPQTIVTRIPPSPTGKLHVGTARTALFNFLFAKQHGGKVILRSEDTDTERSKREYETDIINGLQWLGITWDNETIYRQSERTDIYKEHLEKLIAQGDAYISKEEAAEEGKRSEVIRFKNPNKVVTFTDLVRGEITFDTTELGDFVIAKSLEEPLYHLAVVVDDITTGVTHVIRGEDHISNTPRQILILEALAAVRPQYAHLPLLLGEDRSKLSKRHGAKSINELQELGFIPHAVLNYLAFLGWNPGTDQELFTLEELVHAFTLKQVQKGGAIFSDTKLRWFNHEYLHRLSDDEQKDLLNAIKAKIEARGAEKSLARSLTPLIFERIDMLSDVDTLLAQGEFDYFFAAPEYDPAGLLWKKSESLDEMRLHLEQVHTQLSELEDWTLETIKNAIWEYASENGRGNVLWPFRFALSGQEKSPDPFEIAEILGKQETLARIDTAVARINEASA